MTECRQQAEEQETEVKPYNIEVGMTPERSTYVGLKHVRMYEM